MDQESKARLDEITAKELAALTEDDKAFMRARSSYLTGDQREVFAEVLDQNAASNTPTITHVITQ